MEPKGSLPCSQEHTTGHYPGPNMSLRIHGVILPFLQYMVLN